MMMHLGASHSKRWLWLSCMAAFLLFACANARTQEFSRSTLSDFSPVKKWEATAPGRIEPVSEEIRLSTLVPGRIARVLVAPNDKVFAGELLIRFDDEEALVRLAEAQAQVTMRQRVRDDESKKVASDRRRAGDAVVEAERPSPTHRQRLTGPGRPRAASVVRRSRTARSRPRGLPYRMPKTSFANGAMHSPPLSRHLGCQPFRRASSK